MRLKITFTSSYLTVTQRATRIYRVSPFGVPSGIPESTFTAEGQIIVGLGSGTYVALSAPSASNLRMISDLTVAGKIKWGAGGDVELLSLTNKSGGDLDLGAVVVQDAGNDSAFDTTTAEGDDVIGVLAEGIVNDVSGNVSQIGAQTVLVQGNVSRGDYLISSTTAGRAKSNGSDKSNAFGVAVTAYAGGGAGSVTAILFADIKDKVVGKQSIWVPASAMSPTESNGCASLANVETTAGRPDMRVLDFDATADEHAQFEIAFPDSWNEGTLTYLVYWTSAAADTDGVAWGLQAVAVGNSDTIDVAYGTAVVVTDDFDSAAEDCMITAESAALTVAGSPAAGELCFFRLFRDVSDANDDMTEDARLLGIKLFFTTDAPTDD